MRGEKVKKLREAKAIDRPELAKLVGCGYTTLYLVETRNHRPRGATVRAIAKTLGVRPEELLSENDSWGSRSSGEGAT